MKVRKNIPDLSLIGVYSIINTINGKRYIGSTTRSFAIRMGEHLLMLRSGNHVSKHLQLAWNKYGGDAFEFSIECICSKKDALKFEQVFLEKFLSYKRKYGYNILPTAGNTRGYKPSKSTLEKKRKTMKALYKNSPEFRAKMLIASKISADKHRGKKRPAWLVAKTKKALNRPEVSAKISAALKGRVFTREWLLKLSKWQIGKRLSKEHRSKIGKGVREYFKNKRLKLQLN